VDGELIDTTNDLYASETEAALVGVVDEMLVEALVMPSEILVRVAGKLVKGDQAYAMASDSRPSPNLLVRRAAGQHHKSPATPLLATTDSKELASK
jgi:hypothetical protein